ncbi:MAG TPA: hypothetical protein VIL55_14435 [Naasia sp.]|jgi:hypothetical protein
MSNSYPGNPPSFGTSGTDEYVEVETVVTTGAGVGTSGAGLGSSTEGGAQGKTGAAKEQAGQVAQGAADAGKHVAGVTKDQAKNVAGEAKTQVKNVAGEAKYQAKDLLNQGRTQLTTQASTQQRKAAEGIRGLSDQLNGIKSGQAPSGPAADIVSQVATRLEGAASWLEQREPADLLNEVKQFAARKPGLFIAIAAGVGVVAGRLTKALVTVASDEKDADQAEGFSDSTYTAAYPDAAYTAPTGYSTTSTAGDVTSTYDTGVGGTAYGTGLGGTATGDVR